MQLWVSRPRAGHFGWAVLLPCGCHHCPCPALGPCKGSRSLLRRQQSPLQGPLLLLGTNCALHLIWCLDITLLEKKLCVTTVNTDQHWVSEKVMTKQALGVPCALQTPFLAEASPEQVGRA